MPSPDVGLERTDSVLTVRLDRPDKKNAIDRAMYGAMAQALRDAEQNDDLRCVVFAGTSGAFSSGNDIADFQRFGEDDAMGEVLAFLHAVADLGKPMIAAVDGLAIGIGTTLLLHCDMVFATPRSVFRTPFTDLGLVPEGGSSLLAPRIMGPGPAFALLALGQTFDADTAAQTGIVSAVTQDAEGTAIEAARLIAAKPPEAMRATRRLLRPDPAEVRRAIDREAAEFAQRLRSPEARAAFAAFLGRRS